MIHHFYHIYADGEWQEPLREHMDAVTKHGLDSVLNGFHVGVVGSGDNRLAALAALDKYEVPYSIAAEAEQGWEQVTMNRIWSFVQGRNGLVLYGHTKGAANPTPINHAWRKSMIFYNVVNWETATGHLFDQSIDTVGTHWCNNAFWGGTYWWARASYLARLQPPLSESRFQAEEWIGSGQPRIVDMNPGWPDFTRFVTEW